MIATSLMFAATIVLAAVVMGLAVLDFIRERRQRQLQARQILLERELTELRYHVRALAARLDRIERDGRAYRLYGGGVA